LDNDGDRDYVDLASLRDCWDVGGPDISVPPGCGAADVHLNGHVDLRDFVAFQNAFSPWVRISSTSPSHGEGMVALTRETILTLSGEITPKQAFAPNDFYATFGGATLPGQARITPDGRRIKLFYNPPLPASARVRATFNGDAFLDVRGYPVDADGDGVPGGLTTFDFDTCTTARVPGSVVWGYVTASEKGPGGEELPLEGVTIRVDGYAPSSGECDVNNPAHFCAVSAADGFFWLGSRPPAPGCTPQQAIDPKSPCFIPDSLIPGVPVPEFFIHVDGTTITGVAGQPPSTDCDYPSVGKPFHSVAGYRTQLEMDGAVFDLHLPCVPHESSVPIDPVKETTLGLSPKGREALQELFPDVDPKSFDAFQMTVPMGSATKDDGAPGTTVGVFPIPTARLPAPLPPPGPIHTVDFTVQTDASNFDIPAPICLPNLPDPTTGEIALPGEKSALVSFNHDTGKWEGVGPMTAIDDDSDGIADRVCTDPGVGILAPGWVGTSPASTADADSHGGCEDECCECNDQLDCTGQEKCIDGKCFPGQPPCLPEVCDEETGCRQCVGDSDCGTDDGLFCNGVPACGASGTCTYNLPCGISPCNEIYDYCGSCRNNADCEDGLICNGPPHCTPEGCTQGPPACPGNCMEGRPSNPCGSCSTNEDCFDHSFCNGEESCLNGECANGMVPCDAGLCDPINRRCAECLSNYDCRNEDFCFGRPICDSGSCVPIDCQRFCDPITKRCVECFSNDHCTSDGNYCNGEEFCDIHRGLCVSSGNPCGAVKCDPQDGCEDCDLFGLGKRVADLLKQAATVAADFFKVGKIIKCISEGARVLVNLTERVREAARAESPSCTIIIALKDEIQQARDVVRACGEASNPASRLRVLCKGAKVLAGSIRDFLAIGNCLTGLPGLRQLEGWVSELESMISIMESWKATFADIVDPFQRFVEALTLLLQFLDQIACSNTAIDGEVVLPATTRAMLWEVGNLAEDLLAKVNEIDEADLESLDRRIRSTLENGGEMTGVLRDHTAPEVATRLFWRLTDSRGVFRMVSLGALSTTLRANQPVEVSAYDPASGGIWTVARVTGPPGGRTWLGEFLFQPTGGEDTDEDGLIDEAEEIIGTLAHISDTDSDGIADGVEIAAGTNPLDGRPVTNGVLASAETPGTAVDVCAFNDLAVVADSDRGVSVFDATNGQAPVAIAQVDTPGTALAVTCARDRVAVADGAGGVAIIDTTDPPAAQIVHTIPASAIGGSARAVVAAGNLLFVGSANLDANVEAGSVSLIDMTTGVLIQSLPMDGDIHDLAIDGPWLYALSFNTLHVFRAFDLPLTVVATESATGTPADPVHPSFPRRRLSLGDGLAYIVHWRGFHLIDVGNPTEPQLIELPQSGARGWKQIVPNGSGLGVAAVGKNAEVAPGNDEIYLYVLADCSSGIDNCENPPPIHTPGLARAVSLYNGLAYVADHANGLHVVNYLSYDALGQPPQITSLTISRDDTELEDGAVIEDGTLLLIDVGLLDDVQVRNVELLFNGEVVERDGNFPFQFFVDAPGISTTTAGAGLDITVRAFDTGGNVASQTRSFTPAPDTTPPTVVLTNPHDGETMFQQLLTNSGFIIRFSERYEAATINASPVDFDWAGPNGVFGDSDDEPIEADLVLVEPGRYLRLQPKSTLPLGVARVRLSGSQITDHAGNLLDGDGDGLAGGDFEMQITITSKPAVYWAVDADGQWHEASKWSRLPVAGDDVAINVPGDRTITLSQGDRFLSTLDCTEELVIGAGTLNISAGAIFADILQLNGGRLKPAAGAEALIRGSMFWHGGYLANNGTTRIEGELYIAGSGAKHFDDAAVLDNAGRAVWDNGEVDQNVGLFNNLAGAVMDIRVDAEWKENGLVTGAGELRNFGTIVKSAGDGTTRFAVRFFNHGLVEVDTGTLFLDYWGSSDGVMQIAPGAILSIEAVPGRSFDFLTTAPVAGGGLLRLADGDINWPGGGTLDSDVALFPGTVLNATGNVTITGSFTWTGGDLSGAGTTAVSGDIVLESVSPNTLDLLPGRVLQNTSNMVWRSGTIRGLGGAILRNSAGGVFDIQGDVLADDTGSGSFTIQNLGRLVKTAGLGSAAIESPVIFSNTGEVDVRAGTLRLAGSITQLNGSTLTGGTWIARDNASIDLASRTVFTNSAHVQLIGSNSSFSALNSLAVNAGSLLVTEGRIFQRVGSFTNQGSLTVGAGSLFTASSFFTQNTAGVLTIGIEALDRFGALSTAGTATLAGTLRITVDDGYVPADNEEFVILSYAARSGAFGAIELPALMGGCSFDVIETPTEIRLVTNCP
jgi:hypothetical protein